MTQRGGIGLEVLVDEGGVVSDDAVGVQQLPGDAARAAVARAQRMRLPLRSRRVVIGRSPRVNTQTGSWNSRPTERSFEYSACRPFCFSLARRPCRLPTRPPFTKPPVIPELSSTSARSVRRPSSGRSVLRPSLSLTRVVRRTSTWTPYLRSSSLYLRGQLVILRVARGDDDLALLVELLGVVEDRKAPDPEARGKHRHRARLGDILVHGAPPFCPEPVPARSAGNLREPSPMSP